MQAGGAWPACRPAGRASGGEGRPCGRAALGCGLEIAERALVQELLRRRGGGTECHEGESAPHRDVGDAGAGQLFDARDSREGEDVHRTVERADDFSDVLEPREPGRVEDVGAGLLEGLQACDRVRQVGPAVEEIQPAQ